MRSLQVPGEYPTIQSAVDVAGVNDQILVDAGTYGESVGIGPGKDGLVIRGAGSQSILDGGSRLDIGFAIRASGSVTIVGFAIRRYPLAGIQIDTSGNVIEAVAINAEGARTGIIVASGTQGNLLIDLAVTGTTAAAVRLDGAGTLLVDATIGENDQTGVQLFGPGNRLFGNIIGLNGGDGIVVQSSGNLLVDNQIRRNQGAGVALGARVTGNVISGNRIVANEGAGLLVEASAAGNVVVSNQIDRNHPDIVAERPANTHNAFRANRCRSSIPPGLCHGE